MPTIEQLLNDASNVGNILNFVFKILGVIGVFSGTINVSNAFSRRTAHYLPGEIDAHRRLPSKAGAVTMLLLSLTTLYLVFRLPEAGPSGPSGQPGQSGPAGSQGAKGDPGRPEDSQKFVDMEKALDLILKERKLEVDLSILNISVGELNELYNVIIANCQTLIGCPNDRPTLMGGRTIEGPIAVIEKLASEDFPEANIKLRRHPQFDDNHHLAATGDENITDEAKKEDFRRISNQRDQDNISINNLRSMYKTALDDLGRRVRLLHI